MEHEYKPWIGELSVQPSRCPCCGAPAEVWQYIKKEGADVERVVMCSGEEYEDERLPMTLAACPLNMPPDALYCQTARSAVAMWNAYAENIVRARMQHALPIPPADANEDGK